jgi:hypothetical protein
MAHFQFQFRLNPRAGQLPDCSAVLNGWGTRYEVNDYRTALSIKSVVRGAARYHTPQGHYLLTPDTFLVLTTASATRSNSRAAAGCRPKHCARSGCVAKTQ